MEGQEKRKSDPETFVHVPVPVDRVLEVYALLSAPRAESGRAGESSPEELPRESPWTPPAGGKGLPRRTWSAEDLARFINSGTKTSRTVAAMMDVLAEKPGEQVTTTELVERLGVTKHELRGALAALTRHIHKHYNRNNWPFVFTWGPALGDDYPAEAHYTIVEPDVIAAWAKLRH